MRLILAIMLVSLGLAASYNSSLYIQVNANPTRLVSNNDFLDPVSFSVTYKEIINGNPVECKNMSLVIHNKNFSTTVKLSKSGEYWEGMLDPKALLDPERFGSYNATVVCDGKSYNLSGSVLFVRDEEGPQLVGDIPEIIGNETILDLEFWDPSGVENVSISSNASLDYRFQDNHARIEFNTTKDENVTLDILVTDSLGNRKEIWKNIVVDGSPPKIDAEILSNATFDGLPLVGGSFTIKLKILDASNVSCNASLDGKAINKKIEKGVTTLNIESNEGKHKFSIHCVDQFNHSSTREVKFISMFPVEREIKAETGTNGTLFVFRFYGKGDVQRYKISLDKEGVIKTSPKPDKKDKTLDWYVYLGEGQSFTLEVWASESVKPVPEISIIKNKPKVQETKYSITGMASAKGTGSSLPIVLAVILVIGAIVLYLMLSNKEI